MNREIKDEDDDDDEDFENRPLSNVLENFEGKSGVYFIAPTIHDRDPFLVKIGMSKTVTLDDNPLKRKGGLGRRLDSYLLCYPQGYYLFAVFQTQAAKAYPLEKFIHQYLQGKGFKTVFDHSHSEEWFRLTMTQLRQFIPQIPQRTNIPKTSIFLPQPLLIHSTGKQARQKNPLTPQTKYQFEREIPVGQVLRTMQRAPKDDRDMETDDEYEPMRQPNFTD